MVLKYIDAFTWNVYGKIESVSHSGGGIDLEFDYDPAGNRIMKQVTISGTTTKNYYIRDAQGNIMATYTLTASDDYTWQSSSIYGSSRVGVYNANMLLVSGGTPVIPSSSDTVEYTRGLKQYEVTNHLGNVLSVITDRKIGLTSGIYTIFDPDIVSFTDYYPFGSAMENRTWGSQTYRFGMNGQEKDDEIYGVGNTMSAEYWQYDSRIGRRWNTDQTVKVHESPYACFANNPIWFSDPNGNDTLIMHRGQGEESGISDGGGTALIYPITFSIIENGVERTVNTGHDFQMVSNADGDRYTGAKNRDNELTKQPLYKLSFGLMSNHDGLGSYGEYEKVWNETIRVGSDGVFLHRWGDISWFRGCKGLSTNLQVNTLEGPTTTQDESVDALMKVREIYNQYKGSLTGAKFLLKTNSTAPPTFSPIDIQSIGFGGFNQSEPATGTQPLAQLASPQGSLPKMSRMERTVSKVKIFVGKATGD